MIITAQDINDQVSQSIDQPIIPSRTQIWSYFLTNFHYSGKKTTHVCGYWTKWTERFCLIFSGWQSGHCRQCQACSGHSHIKRQKWSFLRNGHLWSRELRSEKLGWTVTIACPAFSWKYSMKCYARKNTFKNIFILPLTKVFLAEIFHLTAPSGMIEIWYFDRPFDFSMLKF